MVQKRVDHGAVMNERQQPPTGGLAATLLREGRKMLSFGVIGVGNGFVNYAVTVGVTVLVLTPLGLAANDPALGLAKALGWAVAVSNSYLLNTLFTFAHESGRRLSWPTYLRFVASGTVGLAIEVASFLFAVRYLPLSLAAIVPIGLAFVANFAMARLFVFSRPGGRH
ncbi:GtrA family protein [Phreatobacter cathodiphilus]|uniref:GtrA family protein n=2 Tax=Phreatobacter cathodiphilus TaxID=1868589 RepID=A0A2S0N624_9HYPH|nr:GtrA family protein [Phreatobacter cathodiphilus]